jgi:DNA-binding NarL/FixJ family response regulator
MQSLFLLHLLGPRSDWIKLRFLYIIFGGNKMIENKESYPIKVVIVDDHPIVRKGLKALLKSEKNIKVVADCSNGTSAISCCKNFNPDIMLLDVKMPDCMGYDIISNIKKISPQIKIVILTAYNDKEYVEQSIKAGANGFVLKDINKQELVKVIRTVNSGKTFIDPSIARAIVNSVLKDADKAHIESLTSREIEVLNLMSKGLTNAQIAQDLCISSNTAKAHVASIIKKLGASSRTDAVVRAISYGLVDVDKNT